MNKLDMIFLKDSFHPETQKTSKNWYKPIEFSKIYKLNID